MRRRRRHRPGRRRRPCRHGRRRCRPPFGSVDFGPRRAAFAAVAAGLAEAAVAALAAVGRVDHRAVEDERMGTFTDVDADRAAAAGAALAAGARPAAGTAAGARHAGVFAHSAATAAGAAGAVAAIGPGHRRVDQGRAVQAVETRQARRSRQARRAEPARPVLFAADAAADAGVFGVALAVGAAERVRFEPVAPGPSGEKPGRFAALRARVEGPAQGARVAVGAADGLLAVRGGRGGRLGCVGAAGAVAADGRFDRDAAEREVAVVPGTNPVGGRPAELALDRQQLQHDAGDGDGDDLRGRLEGRQVGRRTHPGRRVIAAVDADIPGRAENRDLAVVGAGGDVDVPARGEPCGDRRGDGRLRMTEAAVVGVVAAGGDEDRGSLVAVDAVAVGVDEAEVGLVGGARRAGRERRGAGAEGEERRDGEGEGEQEREAEPRWNCSCGDDRHRAPRRGHGARRHLAGGKPTP